MKEIYVASPYTGLLKKGGTQQVLKVAKTAVSETKKYLSEKVSGYNEGSYYFVSPVIANMFTNPKVPYTEILDITSITLKNCNAVSFFADDEHIDDFIESKGCFYEYCLAVYYEIIIIGNEKILNAFKKRFEEEFAQVSDILQHIEKSIHFGA